MIKCVILDNLSRKEKFCIEKKDIKYQNKSCNLLRYRLCYFDKICIYIARFYYGTRIIIWNIYPHPGWNILLNKWKFFFENLP